MTDKINNYEQIMLDMVLSQFDEKFAIEELTKIFAKQVQEAEDMWFDIITGIRLNDAVGEQLDRIGNDIVNQPRLGLSDNDYRDAIKLKIQLNVSSGQNETLISVVLENTGASSIILDDFSYPATVLIIYSGGILDPDLIKKLNSVKAAGVRIIVVPIITEPVFRYDGDPGEGYDQGHYAGIQQ